MARLGTCLATCEEESMLQQSGGIKLPTASRADRKIAISSKFHCTAYAVLGDDEGYRVQAESHLELCNLLILNANPDVAHLKEQVLFKWDDDGHSRRHFFDVVATLKNGRRIAYTVKPEKRALTDQFQSEMKEIARHTRNSNFCDVVCLVTEKDIDEIDLRNAEQFAAVRQPDPKADDIALKTARELLGAVSLRDLADRTGIGHRGHASLIRLMRKGYLRAETHEVIKPSTLVSFTGVTQ